MSVKYEIAYLAKQKGFNEEIDAIYCLGQYDAERQVKDPNFIAPKNSEMCTDEACSGPTVKELQKWFKKKHKLEVQEKDFLKVLKTLPNVKLKRPKEIFFM